MLDLAHGPEFGAPCNSRSDGNLWSRKAQEHLFNNLYDTAGHMSLRYSLGQNRNKCAVQILNFPIQNVMLTVLLVSDFATYKTTFCEYFYLTPIDLLVMYPTFGAFGSWYAKVLVFDLGNSWTLYIIMPFKSSSLLCYLYQYFAMKNKIKCTEGTQ